MSEKINIVFMGGFTYPRGMAGTKRVQNVINALKLYPDISTRVVLLRQSSRENSLSGVHEGTPYETVMGDVFRGRLLAALPLLYYKTYMALQRAFRPGQRNILYFYGPLFFDSVLPLGWAKKLGYKIVFDVVENFGLAKDVSSTFYLYAKSRLTHRICASMGDLASGFLAISSHLVGRCEELARGRAPVHYLPISVDMNLFPEKPFSLNGTVSLFYAGSFGKKDGLPVLLDAFDLLAARHPNIRFILSGRGHTEDMKEFHARVESSPYKGRIEWKGYLGEKEYYSLLNSIDIPCMTRVDLAFAHAGFPFKLGEYLAAGKPVIASRVSDVERFLENRENALLVKAGASDEICEAVEYVMSNPERAAALGTRGRETAMSFFDFRRQGDSLRSFLDGI